MDIVLIIVLSWLAGLAAWLGGVLARFETLKESELKDGINRFVMAFGGGILVAAIAFALTPEGVQHLSSGVLALVFGLGGVVFCLIDRQLARTGGCKAQLMAMLMDYVPESIALGAVFAHDHHLGFLLAMFIAIQNVPEGFNAYRELVAGGLGCVRTLSTMFVLSFLGPLAAGSGFLFLQDKESFTAGLMCFAAGGILYLIFQDIAPSTTREGHWKAPMGAVLGFLLGMIGTQLIG